MLSSLKPRLALLFFIAFVWSDAGECKEIFETAQSTRALGMGNAFVGVVDDGEALLYNPAGLAKVNGMQWTVLGVGLAASGTGATSIASKADQYQSSSDLEKFYGDQVWLGAHGKSLFAIPYFGFGLYDSGSASFLARNPAYPSLNVNYINDLGLVIGAAVPLAPFLHLGAVAKRVTRTGTDTPVPVGSLLTGNTESIAESFNNRGVGLGMDLGLNITSQVGIIQPTLSFVWKDVGYTSFSKDTTATAPPQQKDEKIIGGALAIDLPLMTLTAAVDYKHTNDPTEDLGKKIHTGVELSLPLLDVRAGFNQGYYTVGLGIDLWLIRFDVASYGVELGEYPGQQQDRRYQATLSMELGFDPSFRILDKSGRPRKLKVRR